jgi:adenine-specific DNA-methyltransferase
MQGTAEQWADRFGLATVPLFADAGRGDERHHVLLDGGLGSFAFSESCERLWLDPKSAGWAWSSGVPHHVTVTTDEIVVVRWDRPGAEEFSRRSVENGLDAFYAYLVADRVQSTRRVVDHLVDVFRRTRSLVRGAAADDEMSVQAYLGVLATAMNRMGALRPVAIPDPDLLASLPSSTVELLVLQTIASSGSHAGRSDIVLLPELTMRHAGSEIFQEAHYALATSGDRDMFDWVSPAASTQKTRGTSHFTPPALARSIVEQTFAELGDLRRLPTLTILDPACGSGSFLYEAVRTARREGFSGELVLIGRDISRAAIDMARFILAFAAGDWTPVGGMRTDLQVADALEAELPQADAVLMNPPFMAWTVMSANERDRMKRVLGDAAKGRVDLSMAFVSRALVAVRPGGAIGAIMPASVLASNAAEVWRSSIRQQSELRMIASLGEYGLFTHAAVNVAALVAKRKEGTTREPQDVVAVIGGRTSEATGDALRAIRRNGDIPSGQRTKDRWQVFAVPQTALDEAPTWRPISPEVRDALIRLEALGVTRPLGEIFEVLQGARTGWVKGFVLDRAQLAELGQTESKWFRPAAMGDNVIGGRLHESEYVFFPYGDRGHTIASEEDLRRRLPTYYERLLQPNRAMLENRRTHEGREDWWTLARPRGWNSSTQPRIVSKYFGGVGGFALDPDGTYVVVQGFGWFLRQDADGASAADESVEPSPDPDDDAGDEEPGEFIAAEGAEDAAAISGVDLLAAYVALFNSKTFEKLLATFSSHVAGGQYDLSWRFVRSILVPDFATLWRRERRAAEVASLVKLGQDPLPGEQIWTRKVERALYGFYGADLLDLL